MELSVCIDAFLQFKKIDEYCSPHTHKSYGSRLKYFYKWFGKELEIEKLTMAHIDKFRVYIFNKGRSKRTIQHYMGCFRSFITYFNKRKLTKINPLHITIPRTPYIFTRQPMTLNEVDKLLRTVEMDTFIGRRNRAILEMLFSTGLRVSELASLNRGQIDMETGYFTIVGKGAKQRFCCISHRAILYLAKTLKDRHDRSSALFVNQYGDRINVKTIQRIVKEYSEAAGIEKHITPHSFRHTFSIDLLTNGAELEEIQEMLGHSKITTTQIYTHFINRDLAKVYKKYHSYCK